MIIIGFFFTPPLFLATEVAISSVYCSPKTIKCTQKPKIEKKFTGIDQSSERASECHSPYRIYNSLLRMRAIHELKNGALKNYRGKKNLKFRDYTQKPQNHSTDKTKTKIIFIPILGGKRHIIFWSIITEAIWKTLPQSTLGTPWKRNCSLSVQTNFSDYFGWGKHCNNWKE